MENKSKKLYLIPHETIQGLYVFTNNLPTNGINNKFVFNLEKPHNFLNRFNIKYKYGNNTSWKSLKKLYLSKKENKELLHKIVSIGSFQIPLEKFVEIVSNRTPTSVVGVNSSTISHNTKSTIIKNNKPKSIISPTIIKPVVVRTKSQKEYNKRIAQRNSINRTKPNYNTMTF